MVCSFKVGVQSANIPREERKTSDMFTVDKMLSPLVNTGYKSESCTLKLHDDVICMGNGGYIALYCSYTQVDTVGGGMHL